MGKWWSQKDRFIAIEQLSWTIKLSVPFLFTDGIDFVGFNKELSFSRSSQTHCVDVTILKDGDDEPDESLVLELTLKYAPFDIPLDTYTINIIDSGEL